MPVEIISPETHGLAQYLERSPQEYAQSLERRKKKLLAGIRKVARAERRRERARQKYNRLRREKYRAMKRSGYAMQWVQIHAC
jgi:hypothetical protein